MSRFVIEAASPGLFARTALANARTRRSDGAQEEIIKKLEHAHTLSPTQGVSVISRLPIATGISTPQTYEPVAALGNHRRSNVSHSNVCDAFDVLVSSERGQVGRCLTLTSTVQAAQTALSKVALNTDTLPKRIRKKKQSGTSSYKSRSSTKSFDVVMMADMASPGDIGLRIGAEIEALSSVGYQIGLIHLSSPFSLKRIAPQIRRCVQAGKASPIDPEEQIRSALLIVHIQHGNFDLSTRLRGIMADRVVIVVDRIPMFDLEPVTNAFNAVGPMSWAPTNRWVRAALEAYSPQLPIEAEDWTAIADETRHFARSEVVDAPITIGHVSGSGATQWPATADELKQMLPVDGSANVLLVGRPPRPLLPPKRPQTWRIFEHGEAAIEWAVRQMDVLVYFPGAEASEIPDAAIVAAMAAGKLVVLPPRLRAHFGVGPVYCERINVQTTISELLADPVRLAELRNEARESVGQRFSAIRYRDRVTSLMGRRRKARRRARQDASRRVVFLASNGIGLGHVARLLAIARRAEGRFEPVFATMAQAAHVIERFGYLAEYVPSHMYVGGDQRTWDDWLGFEVERLVDCYGTRLVVYDGNSLPGGLWRAIRAQDCKLAWVRRSMGDRAPLPSVEEARFCELILEPDEIAAVPRFGEDVARKRRGVTPVGPIRLLDDDEPLTRKDAAAALGLDAGRRAVLIHLGAGSNRDITRIIDEAVRELQRFPDVQIAIAEWANAPAGLSLWPEAVMIKGFPISQYFNAFDFSIGAAGYNTFHETISLELPTIFVANAAPDMDDQVGRARFAQDAGAAFELPEDRLIELPAICEVLLNEGARGLLRENCRRIRRDNGAAEAAAAIGRLVEAQ
jgi:UDP:flavonoid glycosyltransferase YjiC (YdhE family)